VCDLVRGAYAERGGRAGAAGVLAAAPALT
jgi:hypothetical protein